MSVVEYRSLKLYRAVFSAALVSTCIFVGCNNEQVQAGTSKGRPLVGAFRVQEENPILQRPKEQTLSQQAVHLSVYLVAISHNESWKVDDLWNLAGTANLVRTNGQLLARNGLQIGTGDSASLAKVVELLETTPARQIRRIDTYLGRDFEAELLIGDSPDGLTLFRHQVSGSLAGKTYPQCQRLLLATAVVQATGQVRLKIVPVLKAAGTRIRTLRRLAALGKMEPEVYLAEFETLAFDALVGSGEFLIIGSTKAAGDLSFGRAFFDSHDTAPSARIVLLVIPEVLAE